MIFHMLAGLFQLFSTLRPPQGTPQPLSALILVSFCPPPSCRIQSNNSLCSGRRHRRNVELVPQDAHRR